MTGVRRVNLEPAFLLHHYPWRDTSRILELMTRTHGRVSVFSRASRQSGSTATGGALQPFTESLVSWSGRGEAGHLTSAERVRPPATLAGDRLMSGFYANELLLKLLQRNDPHPALFDAYAILIERLYAPDHDPGRRCACSRSGCSTNSAGASTSSTRPPAASRWWRQKAIVTASKAAPSRSMEWRREP
jgi:recombinational DNA repair protein (RecF pathway)